MILRKIKYVGMIMLIACITGCSQKTSPKQASKQPDNNLYISFTTTANVKDKLISTIHYFSLKDEKVKDVASFDYTAQYPLGVYDRENDCIYYSAKDESKGNDQIYKLDVKSKKKKKITNNLFATNYLYNTKNTLYTVSVPQKQTNLQLNLYDINKENNEIKKSEIKDDYSISTANINPISKEMIFGGHSARKEKKMYETQEFEFIDNPIYVYKGGKFELLATPKDETIRSICMNDKEVLYTNEHELYQIDLKSKVYGSYDIGIDAESLGDLIYLDNNNVLYFTQHDNGKTLLCKYDIGKKKKTIIYSLDNTNKEINNAMIGD